jgi:drug/metabolite transporter (DMT)-like permease
MNWIFVSILLFFSSVVQYLLIRKGQLRKLPNSLSNLAMFAIPMVLSLVLMIVQKQSLEVSWWHLGILFVTAFCFSYLGNAASLYSIQNAPNPGYSLIISKSYVVFTTLVAVCIFGSELTWKNAAAIGGIVLGSIIITVNKKKVNEKSNILWIPLAFVAFFAWGGLALISKYLLDQGVSVLARLFYVMFFVTIFIAVEMFWRKTKIQSLGKVDWIIILLIGMASMIFNFSMQLGYQLAPNPGYINAVNAASISLVTLTSAWLFKDELNLRKVAGIGLVTLSLIIMFIA